jgi:uncharacterized RDD family membrane protein YckC
MAKFQRLLNPRISKVSQDASFLRRMCAFILDLLIINLFFLAPFAPVFESLVVRTQGAEVSAIAYTQREVGALMLLFAIIYVYFVLMEYLQGQTVGMMLTNLRMDGDSSLSAVAVRNCFVFPVLPFALFWVIEPIAIGIKRRGVLEYLSRTRTLHQRTILI